MKKKHEIILKVIIAIGGLIYVPLTYYIIKSKLTVNSIYATKYEIISYVFMALLCIDGLLILILGSLFNSKIKPQKYPLKQNDCKEFNKYLTQRAKKYNYEIVKQEKKLNAYKKTIKKQIYYIIEANLKELNDEVFEKLYNNQIFPIIEEDFNKMQNKRYSLYVTFIIGVDRITPTFNKFIETTDIDKLFHKYAVGISFGGKKIYINNDIYNFTKIQKIHKEFLQIMELEEALDK